jgi:hypothetical protein
MGACCTSSGQASDILKFFEIDHKSKNRDAQNGKQKRQIEAAMETATRRGKRFAKAKEKKAMGRGPDWRRRGGLVKLQIKGPMDPG